MRNVFAEVTPLDKQAIKNYHLSEELMMEHAAIGMEKWIRDRFKLHSSIAIIAGPGNNGADGIALARLLAKDYQLSLYLSEGSRSSLNQIQLDRFNLLNLPLLPFQNDHSYDLIVDALFGSGLNRSPDENTSTLIDSLNSAKGYKLACDVPSGLFLSGQPHTATFIADTTLTMGALKQNLFSDFAKDYTGIIETIDLGIHHDYYETDSSWKVLDSSDLVLPLRKKLSSNKGTYGHLAIVCGEKTGAAVIAGSAALRFGSGLVSLISNEEVVIPYELMQSHSLPNSTTAIAIGMGLGSEFGDNEILTIMNNELPTILDADIFYHPLFLNLLKREKIVITPHPKEFAQILRITGIADIDTLSLQKDRFKYVELFCSAYPNVVLILKGSNVLIGHNRQFFINPLGTVALAKGGSGDVLSGLVGALLAQAYSPIEAAICASLAHAQSAKNFVKNNFALTPFDLIEELTKL